jgi:hypothetical protein
MVQPSSAVVFGIFYFAYFLIEATIQLLKSRENTEVISNNFVKSLFIAGFLGLTLALFIYWIPEVASVGWEKAGNRIAFTRSKIFVGGSTIDTSGGIIYGVKDFIIASTNTKIDQPTGLGLFIFCLLVISFFIISLGKKVTTEKNRYLLVSIVWLIIAIIGIEGNALPYKLLPHRFWVFFAIPVATITAFGIDSICKFTQKNKVFHYLTIFMIFIGILITSGYPKYFIETAAKWPLGYGWSSEGQIAGYINLKRLPANALVYSMCPNPVSVIGMDKMDYPWVKETEDYKAYAMIDSLENNLKFLKSYNYSYLIIDTGCIKNFGPDKTREKLQKLNKSKEFLLIPEASNDNFLLFKVLED